MSTKSIKANPVSSPSEEQHTEDQQPQNDRLIYLGPTLRSGLIVHNTIINGEIPERLKEVRKIVPDLDLLIVPVQKLVQVNQSIATPGTPENAVYERLMKGV